MITPRSLTLLALALLALPLGAPHASANSCNTIDVTRSVSGNTADARLIQCAGSYASGTYSSEYRANVTSVTVTTASGDEIDVTDVHTWSYARDPTYAFSSESRQHQWSVAAHDHLVPVDAYVVAMDSQGRYDGRCSEYASVMAFDDVAGGGTYASQAQSLGDGTLLPCTSEDVQSLLA